MPSAAGVRRCSNASWTHPSSFLFLLPKLKRSDDPRVVFVSSGGMYSQRLSLADVEWRKRPYDGVVAYAQTKRMQVVLAEELAVERGPQGISVNSMHPGWGDTPAVRSSLPRLCAASSKDSPVKRANSARSGQR